MKQNFALFSFPWEQRNVTELGKIFIGLVTTMTSHYTDSGCLLIRNSDIKDNRFEFDEDPIYLEESFSNKNKSRMHQIGDVITVHTGDVGTSAVIGEKEDKTLGFATIVTRPNQKIINPNYLSCFFNTDKHKKFAVSISTGDGRTNYNLGDFVELNIPVTILSEQTKIAKFIIQLNSLITLHQRKYDKLTQIKKSLLEKMFPADGDSTPKIRFKGYTEAWEQRELGDIGKTFTGLSGKSSADFGHGEGKFLPYLNIFNNPIADISFLESIEIDNSQNKIQYGDVFFTTSSETPEEVGMSSIWLGNSDNIYLNSFCFGFRPTIKFDSYYFGYLLRSETFRKPVTILAQGISRFNISKNKVMEISIPLPSKDEQTKVGKMFYNLDNLITLHQ